MSNQWDQDNLAEREADLLHRELTLDAIELLNEKNLPKALLDVLPFTNAEANNRAIEALAKTYPVSKAGQNAAVQEKKQALIDQYNAYESKHDCLRMLAIEDAIRKLPKEQV